LRSFAINARQQLDGRLTIFAAMLFFATISLKAQLTTGFVVGAVRDAAGRAASHAAILIKGGAGFKTVIHTNSAGRFTLSLPYGQYLLSSGGSAQGTGVALVVAPLQMNTIDLVIDGMGELHISPQRQPLNLGLWQDATRASKFSEGFSLQSTLASRDPGSVTAPLDFTGLADKEHFPGLQHNSSCKDWMQQTRTSRDARQLFRTCNRSVKSWYGPTRRWLLQALTATKWALS